MRKFIIRSVVVGVLAATALSSVGQAQSPTSQPLVQSGDFRYLGSFRLPNNDGSGASPTGDLTYGGTALAISASGGLFLAGHDWSQRLCEVSIPAIGGTAVIRQRCADVMEGRQGQVDAGGSINLGGTLVHNGRLIVAAYSYYDADANQVKSHFASGTTLSTTGDLTGPVQVGTAGAGFVSGYMGIIPNEWRSLLGGPALTGQCCIAIISRSSSGPAVSVFNPDDVGRVTPVPARQLLGYPLSTPLADANTANAYFTRSDVIGGLAFPAGTRSVLFIGRHGTGQPCYGTGAACGDLAGDAKGDHSYPYYHQVWAYDANELLAVKNGTKQPSQLRPYAMWRLTGINNAGSATMAGATFDPTTRRLYVTERYGENPKVHVYEITAGTAAPPTPTEVCGDNIDNDSDGLIDEGCTAGGGGTPPSPEVCGDGVDNDHDGQIDEGCQSPTTPETCGDGLDNDRDGAIDEGCPGTPQRLAASVKGSTVTLSWLAPIAGTVPAEYIVDAGVAPGQTLYSFSAGKKSSAKVSNVGNGRYYVRVRGVNAMGSSTPSNDVVVSVGCSASPNPLINLITKIRGGLVSMTWTDPDGCTDTSYQLSVADQPSGASVAQMATESNTLTALAGPGVYYVKAASVTAHGVSVPTEEVRVVVKGGGCVPPQFRTQLWTDIYGPWVQLAWRPTSLSEALAADAVAPLQYVLEVGSAPGLTNVLATPVGRTTYIATPAPAGTYYVRVRPADVCGLGTPSNEVIVRVP